MSAAKQETYNKIKTDGVAKPTTPNQTQETEHVKFNHLLKGYLTRSSIYEIYKRLFYKNKKKTK